MQPSTLLILTLAAALAAGPGSLLGARPGIAPHAIGWAMAIAAGLMFGIGYVLLSVGQAMAPGATLLGAALGLILMRLVDGVPWSPAAGERSARVSQPLQTDTGLLLASTLHSAAEGVAIGAAAATSSALAGFLLLTFAVHNISEGAVLGAGLGARGWSGAQAARVAVLARSGQALAALPVCLLLRAVPALLPWCIGASFGALLYLIVAELLPESYRHVGRTGIALLVSLAAGTVALMGGAR